MAWNSGVSGMGRGGAANSFASGSSGTKGWWSNFLGSTDTSGSDWLGAGLSILGGFMSDRSSSRSNREQQRAARELALMQQQSNRESLRAGMQRDQDQYAREIMRNRGAIAPWGQVYRGPRFQGVDPNAPIYNPLMEQGHIFQQLAAPPTIPTVPNSRQGNPG